MSIGIVEKQVLYDNPLAPIVKFSLSENFDELDDMTTDQIPSQLILEHSFKAFSLEDLVKSFDNTINSCFVDQEIIESIDIPQTDLVARSNIWSDLIENLRTSLRNDLKLPQIANKCQLAMSNVYEHDFPSIDDLNDDEEEELREKLDMHSVIVSSNSFSTEPFLTAEQVISEIDFMLQDMTPDSGYYDDIQTSSIEFNFQTQSIDSLNELIENLSKSIQDFSSILVDKLAKRDELEDEKETKNTFIALLFSIQNKRQYYENDKRRSRIGNSNSTEPGTYLTTIIPFDCQHPTYLSIEHLESLNKILHAINEDSSEVPALLTKYILKVLCS